MEPKESKKRNNKIIALIIAILGCISSGAYYLVINISTTKENYGSITKNVYEISSESDNRNLSNNKLEHNGKKFEDNEPVLDYSHNIPQIKADVISIIDDSTETNTENQKELIVYVTSDNGEFEQRATNETISRISQNGYKIIRKRFNSNVFNADLDFFKRFKMDKYADYLVLASYTSSDPETANEYPGQIFVPYNCQTRLINLSTYTDTTYSEDIQGRGENITAAKNNAEKTIAKIIANNLSK